MLYCTIIKHYNTHEDVPNNMKLHKIYCINRKQWCTLSKLSTVISPLKINIFKKFKHPQNRETVPVPLVVENDGWG